MAIANTRARYGTVAMSLHWLIAAALLFNLGLGILVANFMSDQDPRNFSYIQFHKSVGLSILVLSLLRFFWRVVNPIPPLPDNMDPSLKALAHSTHFLLYFIIIFVPLSGWALVSSSPLGLPTPYFKLFHWPNISFLADLSRAQKAPLRREFFTLHMLLAFSAIALVPLHVIGALYHQFRGEDVLRRMLPGTRIAGET